MSSDLAGPDGKRTTMDRTARLMRRVARTRARLARQVTDTTLEHVEALPVALKRLHQIASGKVQVEGADGPVDVPVEVRDSRLASANLLTHFRSVADMGDKGATVNVDARKQTVNLQAVIDTARGIVEVRNHERNGKA